MGDIMFFNFSYELKKILNDSKKEMIKLKHSYIGTEHFILSVLKSNSNLKILLNEYGLNYNNFIEKIIENIGYGQEKEETFIFTPLFKKIIENSIIVFEELKLDYIDADLIFKLILDEGEGVAYRILCELDIDLDGLYNSLNYDSIIKNNSLFNEIGIDLTQRAKDNLIDPIIGREKEIENIIEILLRKNKKNPILIGPAGVGKTAIVEKLACLISRGEVPPKLLNKKIISISMASLVAGTKYRGEFEEKLLNIIKEIEDNNNYILFIDEIHTLMGAGGAEGAIDASNILKPALARDKITIIGATTTEEYRKYIEDDKAFSRRFQKVIINEPNNKELANILNKIKPLYEKYHNVVIDDSIIKYLIKISKKYFKNKKEPDASIDLLDELSSMVSSEMNNNDKRIITLKDHLNKYKCLKKEMIKNNNYDEALKIRKKEREIESIINKSEIKKNKNDKKEIKSYDLDRLISKKFVINLYSKDKFLKNKKRLLDIFKMHKNEINIINKSLEKLLICNSTLEKPISFLFTGNDIILKNKISRKISSIFFNNNIISIDLSEYKDPQSLNKIIGSPPGYVGFNNKNNVFECLKEQPFYIIVFNNIEKACKNVVDLLKEIINKGYFIDSNNYRIDFLNSLIIINSNQSLKNTIGFENLKRIEKESFSQYVNKVINFNKIKISMI